MTIKIPTWMNPYTVEINGQKYSYPAGAEIDVPDVVAEVIQRDIAAHTDTAAPQYVQPLWGKYKRWEKREWTSHAQDDNVVKFQMTQAEYDALLNAKNVICEAVDYDSNNDEEYKVPLDIRDGTYDPSYGLLVMNFETHPATNGAGWLSATLEFEEIKPIPKEYLPV